MNNKIISIYLLILTALVPASSFCMQDHHSTLFRDSASINDYMHNLQTETAPSRPSMTTRIGHGVWGTTMLAGAALSIVGAANSRKTFSEGLKSIRDNDMKKGTEQIISLLFYAYLTCRCLKSAFKSYKKMWQPSSSEKTERK